MSEYIDANMRSAQGFKEVVYRGVAQKLKERFVIEITAEQCKNQIRHQRNAFSKYATFLNIPIANYAELEKVCSEGYVNGEWAKLGNSQAPFGTQPINLDDDENSDFLETVTDAPQATNWVEVDMKEEKIGSTKRVMPSSSKGSVLRKKTKGPSVDQSLRDYIAMIADSVTQVANAIRSITKAVEERKICTELMTELSSIEGFCVEEIEAIHETYRRIQQ